MDKNKILIVDDDANICELIRLHLAKEGFFVAIAYDGEDAIRKFRTEEPCLIILDLMLPKKDGIEVCKEIRKESNVPIIMLTAKSDTFDKVLGLELGADDYIVKPFETKELLARIRAVLRRSNTEDTKASEETLNFPGLSINISNYELKVDGVSIDTPARELELLYFLASNKNIVFTREQLLEKVWGFEYGGESRTIDVHVKRLREKLGTTHDEYWMLKTKHCVGYIFEVYKNEK